MHCGIRVQHDTRTLFLCDVQAEPCGGGQERPQAAKAMQEPHKSVCTITLSFSANCRRNLAEADESDRKLQKLVDDNAAGFAALGLGTLPGRDSGQQVRV